MNNNPCNLWRVSPINKRIRDLRVLPRRVVQEGDWFTYDKYGNTEFRRLFRIRGIWITFDEAGKAKGWTDTGGNLEEFINNARYRYDLKILDPMS